MTPNICSTFWDLDWPKYSRLSSIIMPFYWTKVADEISAPLGSPPKSLDFEMSFIKPPRPQKTISRLWKSRSLVTWKARGRCYEVSQKKMQNYLHKICLWFCDFPLKYRRNQLKILVDDIFYKNYGISIL